MAERELDLSELETVHVSPNSASNYERAMNDANIYRKEQIEELQKLRDSLDINKSDEQTGERRNSRSR